MLVQLPLIFPPLHSYSLSSDNEQLRTFSLCQINIEISPMVWIVANYAAVEHDRLLIYAIVCIIK